MATSKRKYIQWFAEIKNTLQHHQVRTALQVNRNMLILYWYIGNEINNKIEREAYGTNIVEKLSSDLQSEFPGIKGFSIRSLEYMQQFAKAYPAILLPQQAVAELGNKIFTIQNEIVVSIPWGHIIVLLQKCDDEQERLWYIQNTINNNWSRAVLQYQIDSSLYERQHKVKKMANFHAVLPKPQSDLAYQLLKDPYKFEFLQMSEKVTELELERTLVKHLQEFLTELGAGFAFLGRQVKLKIGRKEKILDLFFYHIYLRCFVVIELKMDEFDPAYVGQMNTYLNVVNKQYKHNYDNPSIGIILCTEKDSVEVEFALTNVNHPIGVSEYKLQKALPKSIKDKMPSAKQLQDEVKRFLKMHNRKKKV